MGSLKPMERRVEETDELVRETAYHLGRGRPPHLLVASAYNYLTNLRPHLEGALAALEDIEEHRSLTDEELARRREFKMLLAAAALL
jgi:hypothetical protein